jgi:D-methionine transport system ATP-binding protein
MEIVLNNLEKTYKAGRSAPEVFAVRNISFTIPSNDIFGIIGKSGAGKSTLVRLISLLELPDSGTILYDGQRVDNLTGNALIQRRRRIGMIFQNFNLFSSRTAGQNIAYPLEICGMPKAEIHARVKELLEIVDLADRRDAPVSTLSGGQKQRIAIARALANRPDILFCDEATSALDPQTTKSILNLIRKIQAQMNLTVVMITHQMEVVRDACSLVAVVNNGCVVEQGTVNDIFLHPVSGVTKEFLTNLTPEPDCAPDKDEIVRWSAGGGKYMLRFTNSLTDEPVLSRMARKFNVEFNIRAGGIQELPESRIGTLITDITGSPDEVERAITYLRSEGVLVEEDV